MTLGRGLQYYTAQCINSRDNLRECHRIGYNVLVPGDVINLGFIVGPLSPGRRYQILPAYALDEIVLRRVFQGATDADIFEDFIDQLLQHCNRWPEPKSVRYHR